MLELSERLDLEAQLGEVEHEVVFVEKSKNDLLAEQRRQYRYSVVEIFGLAAQSGLDLDSAILGKSLLCDIQLRHDLDSAGYGFPEFERRCHHLVENTVDAVANAKLFLVRLDVDIGSVSLDGVGENDVDQAHDRCVFGRFFERSEIELFFLFQNLEIGIDDVLFQVVHHLLQLDGVGRTVIAIDGSTKRRLGSDHRLDVVAGHELDVVHREDVGWIDHRESDLGTGLRYWKDRVLPGNVRRNDLNHRFVDPDILEIDRRDTEVLGKERDQIFVADVPQLDQVGTETSALISLYSQGFLELAIIDVARSDQQFAKSVVHEICDSLER